LGRSTAAAPALQRDARADNTSGALRYRVVKLEWFHNRSAAL